jgi:hypothetical protein
MLLTARILEEVDQRMKVDAFEHVFVDVLDVLSAVERWSRRSAEFQPHALHSLNARK